MLVVHFLVSHGGFGTIEFVTVIILIITECIPSIPVSTAHVLRGKSTVCVPRVETGQIWSVVVVVVVVVIVVVVIH